MLIRLEISEKFRQTDVGRRAHRTAQKGKQSGAERDRHGRQKPHPPPRIHLSGL